MVTVFRCVKTMNVSETKHSGSKYECQNYSGCVQIRLLFTHRPGRIKYAPRVVDETNGPFIMTRTLVASEQAYLSGKSSISHTFPARKALSFHLQEHTSWFHLLPAAFFQRLHPRPCRRYRSPLPGSRFPSGVHPDMGNTYLWDSPMLPCTPSETLIGLPSFLAQIRSKERLHTAHVLGPGEARWHCVPAPRHLMEGLIATIRRTACRGECRVPTSLSPH
jgi:hypothetical protein